jgi:hypothetical protein
MNGGSGPPDTFRFELALRSSRWCALLAPMSITIGGPIHVQTCRASELRSLKTLLGHQSTHGTASGELGFPLRLKAHSTRMSCTESFLIHSWDIAQWNDQPFRECWWGHSGCMHSAAPCFSSFSYSFGSSTSRASSERGARRLDREARASRFRNRCRPGRRSLCGRAHIP